MKFTYNAYRGLLSLLREKGYSIRNYHSCADAPAASSSATTSTPAFPRR